VTLFAPSKWAEKVVTAKSRGSSNCPSGPGEYLFEIVLRRYETCSTMMTSNRPLED
jgi:hypothetical protein